MDEALRVAELTEKDLQRRLKAMQKMWTEIVLKIEEFTGLSPQQLQEYYVSRILHQTITV